jgi:Xaa-Pro aminopeptidase
VWQEDEDWGRLVAGILKDRAVATGKVGFEERVRFFIADAVRAASPQVQFVLATPVTAGCRMFKSPAEIALMQRANDITIEAYRAAFAALTEGMTQFDFGRNVRAAFEALGAPGGSAGVQFGEYTAFPHGSIQPQQLVEGDVVLVDGGCSVEGYQSDITRTTVYGKPSTRQTHVWNLEKEAQAAAFRAAQVGATCESVDAAARKVITDAGFGPDYKVPGLPHRTGHGIGMDGHEWTNFVRGNKTRLAPGMCFSDEPMIAIYGELASASRTVCTSPRTVRRSSRSRARRLIGPLREARHRKFETGNSTFATRVRTRFRLPVSHLAFFSSVVPGFSPAATRAVRQPWRAACAPPLLHPDASAMRQIPFPRCCLRARARAA